MRAQGKAEGGDGVGLGKVGQGTAGPASQAAAPTTGRGEAKPTEGPDGPCDEPGTDTDTDDDTRRHTPIGTMNNAGRRSAVTGRSLIAAKKSRFTATAASHNAREGGGWRTT